jgi:chaperonin GroES
MKWSPTSDRVIVEPAAVADEEVTESGIVVPRTVRRDNTYTTGKVLASGPDSPIKQGATVLFTEFAGTKFEDGDKSLRVLEADEILAQKTGS